MRSCHPRRLRLILSTALLLSPSILHAQPAQAPAKPFEFEIVSRFVPARAARAISIGGATPDGFSAGGQSLQVAILLAYFPQGPAYWEPELVLGGPKWLNDPYDIEARVAPADLEAWKKQGPTMAQRTDAQPDAIGDERQKEKSVAYVEHEAGDRARFERPAEANEYFSFRISKKLSLALDVVPVSCSWPSCGLKSSKCGITCGTINRAHCTGYRFLRYGGYGRAPELPMRLLTLFWMEKS